jgi:hypothetical protein
VFKWGDFLKADWETWHGRGVGNSRAPGRTGRGRGRDFQAAGREREGFRRGSAEFGSWHHNALPFVDGVVQPMLQSEEELDDTGTSPVKNKDAEMTDRDS